MGALIVPLLLALLPASGLGLDAMLTGIGGDPDPGPVGAPSDVVALSYGQVQGYRLGSAAVFLGIPFAQPPTGPRRFRAPAPPTAWAGVRSFVKFGPACPQAQIAVAAPKGSAPKPKTQENVKPPAPRNQSEDCLTLNVFTANMGANASGPQPVMVFIHGGAFIEGWAGSYVPPGVVNNLVSRGVLVVTFQYRLNVFGFFTAPKASGLDANPGILDQVAVLRWVQAEIGKFGGDPGDVTIFGESAGSASVSLHTYSPMSRGLFHKAIMESGTAQSPWALDGGWNYQWPYSRDLSVEAMCVSSSDWADGRLEGLADCVRRMSWQSLLALSDKVVQIPEGLCCGWSPVVDGPGGFLPDWPRNLLADRPSIPILLGTNHDEMYLFLEKMFNDPRLGGFNFFNYYMFMLETELYGADALWGQHSLQMKQLLRYVYVDSSAIAAPKIAPFEWLHSTERMTGGCFFFGPTMAEVAASQKTGANVYLYSLDYISKAYPWPKYPATGQPINGSFHSYDLYYLFQWDFTWNWNDDDIAISNEMGVRWTNFAKTGDPNLPVSSSVHWDAVEVRGDSFLSIDIPVSLSQNYHRTEANLWNVAIPSIITNGAMGPTFPGNTLPFTEPPTRPPTPKNWCLPSPCGNHGTCSSFPGGPFCSCAPGFTGPTCAQALPNPKCLVKLHNQILGGPLRLTYTDGEAGTTSVVTSYVAPSQFKVLNSLKDSSVSVSLIPFGTSTSVRLASSLCRNGVARLTCDGDASAIHCYF